MSSTNNAFFCSSIRNCKELSNSEVNKLQKCNKIIIPFIGLNNILNKENEQKELFFKLCGLDSTRNEFYVGVHKISDKCDRVFLPDWIIDTLSIDHLGYGKITLDCVELPKAEYCKLIVPESFSKLEDPKLILNKHLCEYNNLSVDLKIKINFAKKDYTIKVAKLEPANHVSITNTDLKTDIEIEK